MKSNFSGYKFQRHWNGTRAFTSYRYYSKGAVYKSFWKIG